ncbi:MAG: ribosome maturation factor RimP [Candidatus Dormibacteraeota bacterium]|nr:ribosome maturation factor RimP [Candidatus Dormibacteraeota bacterium]
MNNETAADIGDLLRPSLEHLGFELLDVQWSGLGKGAVLKLVIDRPGGVTLDDCERASNTASAVLDSYDPIDSTYRLEVSSPGAERPLRSRDEWRAALGRRVNVRVRHDDSETVLEGRLVGVSDMHAELEIRDRRSTRTQEVALPDVIAARIVVDI